MSKKSVIIGSNREFTKRDSKLDKFVVTSLAERKFVISAGAHDGQDENSNQFEIYQNYNILDESFKDPEAKSDNSAPELNRKQQQQKRRHLTSSVSPSKQKNQQLERLSSNPRVDSRSVLPHDEPSAQKLTISQV